MAESFDAIDEGGIEAILPSGKSFFVLTESERDYIAERIANYERDNKFTNMADIAELDKIVSYEMLIHRWLRWLSMNQDYYGDEINAKQLSDTVDDFTTQVGRMKRSLGIDKVTRDRTHGDDSVEARWSNMTMRAGEFSVMRDKQHAKTIESMHRLKSLLIIHDNCTASERLEQHCRIEDLIEVLRDEIVEFDQIDADFRKQQRMWIREFAQ